MNSVEGGEVVERGGGEDAVAVVQRADVHHTQVQQLQDTSQERIFTACNANVTLHRLDRK